MGVFSTFPQFGLKVDEGFLVSKVLNDSLPQKTDSLLAFKECVLTVNPLDYFLKNKISVYNLSLKNVAVYAYRNKTGKANWEIVKTSSDTLAVEKDTISTKDLYPFLLLLSPSSQLLLGHATYQFLQYLGSNR